MVVLRPNIESSRHQRMFSAEIMVSDKLKGARKKIKCGTRSFLSMTLHKKKQKSGSGFQTRLKVQLKEREDGPKAVVKVTATVMYDLLQRADPRLAQTL